MATHIRGAAVAMRRHRRAAAARATARTITGEQVLLRGRRFDARPFSAERAPFMTPDGHFALLIYEDVPSVLTQVEEIRPPAAHPNALRALFPPGVHYAPWSGRADGFTGWELIALDRRSRLVATHRLSIENVANDEALFLALALARRDLEAVLDVIDDSHPLPPDSTASQYLDDSGEAWKSD